MVYLEQFRFPDAEVEFDFFHRQKRTCYEPYYPFFLYTADAADDLLCLVLGGGLHYKK